MRELVAAVVVAAFGFGCGGDDFTPTLEQPWRPGKATASAECDGACVEIADVVGGHTDDLAILADPRRDDPRRQWQQCFLTFYACWEEGGAIPACVAGSTCPSPCRAEFARRVGDAADLPAQLDAYRAVFVAPEAPCRDPGPPAGVTL